jgi:hypothetical protein
VSRAALELNDAGLTLVQDGEVLARSPGYAFLARDGVKVGESARAAARLEPLNVSNRFWRELDDAALPVLAAGGRSNADLAFQHLRDLAEPASGRFDSLVAVVPASIKARQLMLLLGIAREAGLPLAGFVDAAVATAAAWGGSGRFIYVDLHLHDAVLTAVEVGDQANRERFESVARAGLGSFTELWMKLVANHFVARTRFDPLHEARSEQNLFEALPGWLEALGTQLLVDAEVNLGGETHHIELTREQIETEAQPLYSQILLAAHRLRRAGHATTIALSDTAARVPGLSERFADFHDCDVVVFPPATAALAATELDIPWSVEEESAPLMRSTPLLGADTMARYAPRVVQRARPAEAATLPTHALYRGLAHAVSARPLVIGSGAPSDGVNLRIAEASAGISRVHCSLMRGGGGEAQIIDHSRHGTWLNDERVLGRAPLRAGDRVRVGTPGVTLELIAIGQ